MGDEDRFSQSRSAAVEHMGTAVRVDKQAILVCRIDVRGRDAVDGHARDLLFRQCLSLRSGDRYQQCCDNGGYQQ